MHVLRHELLILADGGGSNISRPRVWKRCLQELVADRYGLAVTVCCRKKLYDALSVRNYQ